ncbi:MAG: hypothetical protein ACR2M3_12770 [Thermomicrobiales bacterium]
MVVRVVRGGDRLRAAHWQQETPALRQCRIGGGTDRTQGVIEEASNGTTGTRDRERDT